MSIIAATATRDRRAGEARPPRADWSLGGDTSAEASGLRSPGKSKGMTFRPCLQLIFKAAGPADDKFPVSRA